MATKIGINGFGRIGRYLVRLLADVDDLEITVINARSRSNESLAHLLKYDSIRRRFPYPVEATDKGMIINGKPVAVTRYSLGEWNWAEHNVDILVETTGTLKDRDKIAQHIQCGARRVLVSAPVPDADAIIVMGVNDRSYDPQKHFIVSAASCTTNCLAPAAMVVDEKWGIRHGLMTTIHSYTMSQRLLDGSHKDLRRSRAAAISMIPTSTGAAKAISLVYPPLKDKLDGMAVRVPTPNVSMVDLTVELHKPATPGDVNAALKYASENRFKNNMGYSDEPLVSVDYYGSIYGGIVDAQSTMVIDNTMLKLIIWYDNESGFTHQLRRLLRLMEE